MPCSPMDPEQEHITPQTNVEVKTTGGFRLIDWAAAHQGCIVDWIITAFFGTITLSKFSEGGRAGFSWCLIAQLSLIFSAWMGVIAVICLQQRK